MRSMRGYAYVDVFVFVCVCLRRCVCVQMFVCVGGGEGEGRGNVCVGNVCDLCVWGNVYTVCVCDCMHLGTCGEV